MRKPVFAIAVISLFATCIIAARNTVVHFSGPIGHDKVILKDYDSGEPIDSATVSDSIAVFDNSMISPRMAIISDKSDGESFSVPFILDDSDISIDIISEIITGGVRHRWNTTGGLNDSVKTFTDRLRGNIVFRSHEQVDSFLLANRTNIFNEIRNNIDNPLAYFILISEWSNALDVSMLEELIALNPELASYNKIREALNKVAGFNSTRKGHKFTDYEVSYNGVTHRLSDVVGHGDYVLLDFWASWCMPCRQEMPVIKKVFEQFAGKNLKIISQAVSDEPEESLNAASQMDISWDVWVNGGKDLMSAYSIEYIPELILFGPDGTIVERDALHGENIVEIISQYIK